MKKIEGRVRMTEHLYINLCMPKIQYNTQGDVTRCTITNNYSGQCALHALPQLKLSVLNSDTDANFQIIVLKPRHRCNCSSTKYQNSTERDFWQCSSQGNIKTPLTGTFGDVHHEGIILHLWTMKMKTNAKSNTPPKRQSANEASVPISNVNITQLTQDDPVVETDFLVFEQMQPGHPIKVTNPELTKHGPLAADRMKFVKTVWIIQHSPCQVYGAISLHKTLHYSVANADFPAFEAKLKKLRCHYKIIRQDVSLIDGDGEGDMPPLLVINEPQMPTKMRMQKWLDNCWTTDDKINSSWRPQVQDTESKFDHPMAIELVMRILQFHKHTHFTIGAPVLSKNPSNSNWYHCGTNQTITPVLNLNVTITWYWNLPKSNNTGSKEPNQQTIVNGPHHPIKVDHQATV